MTEHDPISINAKNQMDISKVRLWFVKNPEWWVWLLCGYVWIVLFAVTFGPAINFSSSSNLFYCLPGSAEVSSAQSGGMFKEISLFEKMKALISGGMVHWIFMLIAMMFPLLRRPIRHISSTLKRKDSNLGVMVFLIGYTSIWTLIGATYLIVPLLVELINSYTSISPSLLNSIVFFVSAALILLPSRPEVISRCEQTRPIETKGLRLYSSCYNYGIRIGINCLRMCWAPMLAMVLAHHNILLMLLVTTILFYERYRVNRSNKIPAFAWGFIGLMIVYIGV